MAIIPTTNALAELKVYVDNLSDPVVSDVELSIILSKYALVDSGDTVPNGSWNVFDMYAAAAECWRIKSARAAKYISFNADGQQISLSQIKEACEQQYAYYTALTQTRTISVGEEE